MTNRDTLETAKRILVEVYKDDTSIVSKIVCAYYDNNITYIAETMETLISYLMELKKELEE